MAEKRHVVAIRIDQCEARDSKGHRCERKAIGWDGKRAVCVIHFQAMLNRRASSALDRA